MYIRLLSKSFWKPIVIEQVKNNNDSFKKKDLTCIEYNGYGLFKPGASSKQRKR